MHVVFNSTYKVSQSLYKKSVFLLVKESEKHPVLAKRILLKSMSLF